MFGSCIAAGIYSTNTPDAVHYISEHSKGEVVVLEGNKQLSKYTEMTKDLPCLKAIVVYDEEVDRAIAEKCKVPVYSWEEFLELGADITDSAVDKRNSVIKPGNCASLIYTSGTTGPPKAVMISHDNITWTTKAMCDCYLPLNHTDRFLSYLPLSHIAAQLIDIYVPIRLGAGTYFAQQDALKGSLTKSMKDVRPTIFFGVPRVWEKIHEKMVQMGRDGSIFKKGLVAWAKSRGTEHIRRLQYGNEGGVPPCYSCANTIVFSNLKKALGLDKCKGCFTAAAPISVDTLNYFASLDIPIYEVFGQSECTGPHTVNNEGVWKIGTCGRPLWGTQSKVDDKTGELCYRGRHVFMGYMYMPEETESTIDNEGYLHSGDVAEFDDDNLKECEAPSGFMKITGRMKDLIITAGGENIPPLLIESQMKTAMEAVSNCVVVGDRRKFLAMLITLKTEVDHSKGEPSDKLAADALYVGKSIGSSATTVTEAAADPLWAEYFTKSMKEVNAKTTSAAQIIQKWKLLPVDFSESAGDLTPTLKVKRNVILKNYEELIDSIYAGEKTK
jgi:long-chain-fatty-acid--CoA ligase ACSBG